MGGNSRGRPNSAGARGHATGREGDGGAGRAAGEPAGHRSGPAADRRAPRRAKRAGRAVAGTPAGAPGGGRTRLTRRGRIVVWSGVALAVLLVGAGGAAAWIYQSLNGNIHAADLDNKIGGGRPVNLSPGSKNIVVVGSDSRDGANSAYGKGLSTMQSDTLMVLHLSADRKWATVVSLPRDSWVDIPSCDRGDGTTSDPHHFKINESFAIGGTSGEVAGAAACTIKTVEQNTGLRIDHFMSVDFQGFKGMVNALDGIEVCPEEPINDKKASLDLAAGCQTVRDEEALGYVRTRYSTGDGSDLGRIGRQQEFMEALAAKAQQRLSSPDAMYGFLDSATRSLTTDRELAGIKPLAGLASEVNGIPRDRLTFVTVPNYAREADVPSDKANVVWQYPQAADLFDALAKDREVDKEKLEADAARPVHARTVRVRVLNGTGIPGRAAKVADTLRTAGFTVSGVGNAPEPAERTEVDYPEGLEDSAEVLSSRVPGSSARQDTAAAPGEVTLTVGTDFDTVR
ncbi:LCP family protein [Streptomyces sp. NRRL F-5135]|uniref:LCP family protein n=1 Tax=Streptomyces sp. NRRL F-5135 TaxID=1463858 RepID=UPI00099D11AD|nr:LCP family protein [Streptomyces sp. NRRL F-5135]